MRVSAKAEYACIAMLELAARASEPQPVRVKAIAEAHGIPVRFLVQIMQLLKGAGLVASTRGISGGYYLARPAERISLADIIGLVDRDEPRGGTVRLRSPTVQTVRSLWQEIHAIQQRRLAETTLADLLQRTQSGGPLMYQI
jgi:Rrf2 family protein